MKKSFFAKSAIIITTLVLIALPAATVFAQPSNKWRIEVSEDANSDGIIIFRLTPVSGESFELGVFIKNETRENEVAEMIRDAFKVQLPQGMFHIEVDDGEDVLVKKTDRMTDFDLKLISSTVQSVRIELERE